MLDNLREKCGLFGIWADPLAGEMSYLGLYAQQHRGQEGAGIVSLNSEGKQKIKKGLGLVGEVFDQEKISELKGQAAIGHLRYATYGKKNLSSDVQPLTSSLKSGPVALSHNGHFINGNSLLDRFKKQGFVLQGSSDTECLLPLLAQRKKEESFLEGLKRALRQIEGAYSLLLLTQDSLFAVRDPYGFRPFVLGYRLFKSEKEKESQKTLRESSQKDEEEKRREESFYGLKHFREGLFRKSVVLASETCAFDLIGVQYKREIQPGEIFYVDKTGEHSSSLMEDPLNITLPQHLDKTKMPIQREDREKEKKSLKKKETEFQSKVQKSLRSPALRQCVFEHVYFARPDSLVFGLNVYESRKRMGQILASEDKVKADIVIPVPDSGLSAALGYSQASQLPFELGIVRNHYVGRTFIQSYPNIRHFSVKVKLNPHHIIKGKNVVVVDDSLVRGTTAKQIIHLIRRAGAKKIHFRLSSPPIIGPCYYGIDTPQKSQLIASQKTLEELRSFLKVDTLQFLSLEGLLRAVKEEGGSEGYKKGQEAAKSQKFCTSCFTGKYPSSHFVLHSRI